MERKKTAKDRGGTPRKKRIDRLNIMLNGRDQTLSPPKEERQGKDLIPRYEMKKIVLGWNVAPGRRLHSHIPHGVQKGRESQKPEVWVVGVTGEKVNK